MYAITGITGQIGSQLAERCLKAGKLVRAIVRNLDKGQPWKQKGCELAVADLKDTDSLARAFENVEVVFALLPPNFDPTPGFSEAKELALSIRSAIEKAKPRRVIYLSTIGAQATQENLLTQHTIAEKILSECSVPVTFLRPAWFMENFSWDIETAKNEGMIPSFLQPLDRKVPMVATADIADLAFVLLQETWSGHRVVNLEGPHRISPNEIAKVFTEILGKKVEMQEVPHSTWENIFRLQGMKNPGPRIRMLDGFNEGWIDFEGGDKDSKKGRIEFRDVLQSMIKRKR